jgi:hypothetical protein
MREEGYDFVRLSKRGAPKRCGCLSFFEVSKIIEEEFPFMKNHS